MGFLILGLFSQSWSQTPSALDILKKVDENLTSERKIIQSKMIVHGRRGSRTIVAKSYIEGTERSFTEYLSPPRERGTKMLKLGDNLWTYSPAADRIIRISGHMLRQSVMGSDLSYEDMMEDPVLHRIYEPIVEKEDTVANRKCWVLLLKAKKRDVAYATRRLWVDQERFIPLKEELYAKSGKLLKTVEIKEVMKVQGQWQAKRIIFKDVLKSGKGTEFIVEKIELNAKIPDYIFSKAALRR
ncbi:MAG: outer membrane lipoprotein-sorting protein [Calditrichaeota bacterium]|nr:outer membrane lipoprotein-sorting protein [Calditrichota bacterium]